MSLQPSRLHDEAGLPHPDTARFLRQLAIPWGLQVWPPNPGGSKATRRPGPLYIIRVCRGEDKRHQRAPREVWNSATNHRLMARSCHHLLGFQGGDQHCPGQGAQERSRKQGWSAGPRTPSTRLGSRWGRAQGRRAARLPHTLPGPLPPLPHILQVLLFLTPFPQKLDHPSRTQGHPQSLRAPLPSTKKPRPHGGLELPGLAHAAL